MGRISFEVGILRIVRILRLFFGVQVIEVAEELVETVHGRQKFVAITEMILSKLSGGISERLHDVGDRGIFGSQADVGSRQSNLRQPRTNRRLSGDECCAACGTTLLAVPVGEERSFFGDAIDVRRAISHHAQVVGADVVPADIVAHDEKDVRFLISHEVCLLLRTRMSETWLSQ